jgi:hypothetical protein
MRNLTISAVTLAVLGIMFVATIASHPAGSELAKAEGYSVTVMPIDEITLSAKNMSVQKFDAF